VTWSEPTFLAAMEQPVGRTAEYDEMVSGDGMIRPEWRALIGSLQAMPEGALAERVARIYRHYEDVANPYNIDGDRRKVETRRPFDLVPMLLSAVEWSRIEAAVIQRAHLLDAILADLYGKRLLVAEGVLPAALLHANPRFLRPCCGIDHGPFVQALATDLIRRPDGSWCVAADRLQALSGIGFAWQNRGMLARIVPEIFRSCPVRRIEPFFELWQAALSELAPDRSHPPRIAVMTPGPFNASYFEHVYLARNLGALLVEGADLTFRDHCVYVKTLGRLQRIDVVLRFLEDDFCDPLELRANSVLGVAGLLQAIRAGKVAMVNMPGAGLAETPALRPFLPLLSQKLLGEALAMPSAEPHMPPSSVVPVWTPEGLFPQPVTLRVFLCRFGDTYRAMPGGYALVPHQNTDVVTPIAHMGMSKDVWVLAGEDDAIQLGSRTAPLPLHQERAPDVLRSRMADDLFWLGRYTERLDQTARLMRSLSYRLAVDRFGPGQRQETQHLLQLLIAGGMVDPGAADILPDSGGLLLAISMAWSREKVLYGIFREIERIAQSLRDRFSNDLWRVVVDLLREARHELEQRPREVDRFIEGLDGLLNVIAAFNGMASENMTRNSGWRFLDIGRRLERALSGAATLEELLHAGPQEMESAFGLALELFDSAITYRSRYLGALQPGPVLDLVLADDSNPRAMAFQIAIIARHLAALAAEFEQVKPDQALILQIREALRTAPISGLDGPGGYEERQNLIVLCGTIRDQLLTLSDMLTRTYFSHIRMPHAVGYRSMPHAAGFEEMPR